MLINAMKTSDTTYDDVVNMTVEQSSEIQSNYMSELEVKLNERRNRLDTHSNNNSRSASPSMGMSTNNTNNSSHHSANRAPLVPAPATMTNTTAARNQARNERYNLNDSDGEDSTYDFSHVPSNNNNHNSNNSNNHHLSADKGISQISPSNYTKRNSRMVSFEETTSSLPLVLTPQSVMSKASSSPFDILSQSNPDEDIHDDNSYVSLSYSQENFDDLDSVLEQSN